MSIKLKQSTASQEIPLGTFVDSADGDTAETGLTIANTDIKLWKMGATSLADKNSGGATHMAGGVYYCTLDATDTGTLGGLVIFVHVSGALAVKCECEVLPANVYDSLIGGTDNLQVETVAIAADAITAAATASDFTTEIQTGLSTASDLAAVAADVLATKAKTDNLPSDPADASDIAAAFGTVNSTLSTIAGYVDTEVASIKAKTDLIPASPAAVGDIPTVGAIADQVWDEIISGHAGVGSTGAALSAAGGSGDPWSTALPGAYGAGTAGQIVGDYLDAAVSSLATQTSVDDLPTSAELAASLAAADDAVLAAVAAVASDVDVIREYADNTVIRGTVSGTSPTTSTFTCSALSPAGVDADQFKGRIIVFDTDTTTAALRGQATDITASSAAGLPLLTFTALTTAPASGDSFSIV